MSAGGPGNGRISGRRRRQAQPPFQADRRPQRNLYSRSGGKEEPQHAAFPGTRSLSVVAAATSAQRQTQVVCATTPSPFFAVGESYWDFCQATDEEVRDLLRAAPGSRPAAVSAPGPTEAAVIRIEAAMVAEGAPADHVLFDLVGDAHFVLIGEASHGTSEFYTARARMTRRLIEEQGFCAVRPRRTGPTLTG
jgi:hypothetical protein